MNEIWVVEMLEDGDWLPTIGVALSRSEGRVEKEDWCRDNPNDRFRIRKYVRQEKP